MTNETMVAYFNNNCWFWIGSSFTVIWWPIFFNCYILLKESGSLKLV